MKFSKCLEFLMELNDFDNVYVSIESNSKNTNYEEYLLDDMTISDLSPFYELEFRIFFDGLHDGDEGQPIFKLMEVQ